MRIRNTIKLKENIFQNNLEKKRVEICFNITVQLNKQGYQNFF